MNMSAASTGTNLQNQSPFRFCRRDGLAGQMRPASRHSNSQRFKNFNRLVHPSAVPQSLSPNSYLWGSHLLTMQREADFLHSKQIKRALPLLLATLELSLIHISEPTRQAEISY